MELAKKYRAEGAEVPYLLDTGDGQRSKGAMQAATAAEIVRCASSVADSGVEGWELEVNGRMLFPASAFEAEEAAKPAAQAAEAKAGRGRRAKA